MRMCQPVSPSINSDFQPFDPQTNSHASSAMKKQSEKEGIRTRRQTSVAGANTPASDSSETGSKGWVEVANGFADRFEPC